MPEEEPVRLNDIIEAIRTIKAFVDFREQINELLMAMYSAGVDISRVNFNNPMSLIQAFSALKKNNPDFDIDTVLDELQHGADITLDDIDKASRILSKYASVSHRIDSTLKRFSRMKKTSMEELEAITSMFGLTTKSKSTAESIDETDEEDYELTEDEIEEMKEVIRRYQAKKESEQKSL